MSSGFSTSLQMWRVFAFMLVLPAPFAIGYYVFLADGAQHDFNPLLRMAIPLAIVVAVALFVRLAVAIVVGPVSVSSASVFNPLQWYLGRVTWDTIERIDPVRNVGSRSGRAAVLVRRGVNVHIPLTAVSDPAGLLASLREAARSTVRVFPERVE